MLDENEDNEGLEPDEVDPEGPSEEEQAQIENGEVCGNCGSEFAEHQGEPALCTSCWDKADEEGRTGFVRSNSTIIE